MLPKIIPMSELKNSATLSELVHQSETPVVVTKNGHSSLVIMTPYNYDAMQAKLDIYSKLIEAQEYVGLGRVSELSTFITSLRDKYGV